MPTSSEARKYPQNAYYYFLLVRALEVCTDAWSHSPEEIKKYLYNCLKSPKYAHTKFYDDEDKIDVDAWRKVDSLRKIIIDTVHNLDLTDKALGRILPFIKKIGSYDRWSTFKEAFSSDLDFTALQIVKKKQYDELTKDEVFQLKQMASKRIEEIYRSKKIGSDNDVVYFDNGITIRHANISDLELIELIENRWRGPAYSENIGYKQAFFETAPHSIYVCVENRKIVASLTLLQVKKKVITDFIQGTLTDYDISPDMLAGYVPMRTSGRISMSILEDYETILILGSDNLSDPLRKFPCLDKILGLGVGERGGDHEPVYISVWQERAQFSAMYGLDHVGCATSLNKRAWKYYYDAYELPDDNAIVKTTKGKISLLSKALSNNR